MKQAHKKQTVCVSELLYVYDPGLSGAAASVICPNCGAPVEKLGAKQCRYCGSALHVSGIGLDRAEGSGTDLRNIRKDDEDSKTEP